jgi:hypothetical protein
MDHRSTKVFALLVPSLIAACDASSQVGFTQSAFGVTQSALAGTVSVRDYGAIGDGVTNDRAAIQNALDSGAAEVVVPVGTYAVSRGAGYWCVSVPAGVTLRGENRDGAVLQQVPGIAGSVRLLQVAAANVTIRDLTLDGNRTQQTADEHRAGVFATGARGLTIRGVTSRGFTGDGFYVHQGSHNATLDDVAAIDNGRNGITFGGGTTGGTVTASRLIGNAAQQLDSEPGPGSTVDGVTIRGNTIDGAGRSNDYAVTVSGSSATSRSHGWTVESNTIHGGVFVVWADDVAIRGNTGVNPTTKASATVYRAADGVTIEGNRWTMTQAQVSSLGVITVTGTGTGNAPAHVRIARNVVIATGRAQSFGVRVDGGLSVEVTDNDLRGPGLAAPGYAGVYLRATNGAEDFRSAIVRRNAISNWGGYGVSVQGNGTARLLAVDVTDNVFDDTAGTMTSAVSLDDGTGTARAITLSGNVIVGGVVAPVARYPIGASVLVAGQRGAGGTYSVAAAPDGVLAEVPGAVASCRTDGTVWRKIAGSGATGWVAL